MSTQLQSTIHDLSQEFANGILNAIKGASLDEILSASGSSSKKATVSLNGSTNGVPKKKRGRMARRSSEDIEATVTKIVELLQNHPDGLRAEEIREALKMERKELPKPILAALASKQIKKTGQKRATVYTAKK